MRPYTHDLEFNEMISRLLNSDILSQNDTDPTYCRHFILKFMERYNYIYVGKNNDTLNIDKIVSKKILNHLDIFFKMNSINPHTNKTHKFTKRTKFVKNKTFKKRSN